MSVLALLKDRLRSSAILISAVVALIVLDAKYSRPGAEGLWLLPLLMFFSLGTTWDIVSMVRLSQRPVIRRRFALLAVGLVTLSATLPSLWPLFGSTYPADCPVGELGWIVIAATGAMFFIMLSEMWIYQAEQVTDVGPPMPDQRTGAIERVGMGGFVIAYVGLSFGLMVALRNLGSGNWGLAALLTMIATTKSADTGAYFAGKSFGKHKLIPRLSPGKTWQGLAGGVITATIVAYLCLKFLFPWVAVGSTGPVSTPTIPGVNLPIVGALLLGPLLTIAGLFGDLAESMIKRDSRSKDSGTWLPGLGGVWDVTDSLIAAVLPAFLCYVAGVGSG